jgi:hypothetical protein
MITRDAEYKKLLLLLKQHRIVGLLGARQVGKSTLGREIMKHWKGSTVFFDLEDPADEARLADPMLALRERKGLIVLDKIQRRPDLFPILRVLADKADAKTRFLVTGSALPELMKSSAESLAGRIAYHELQGLGLVETGAASLNKLWLRGGFPLSFSAKSEDASNAWRRAFISTFLERDMPQMGVNVSAPTMRRFWTMLAHWHGQTWNASEFSRSFGVSDQTVRGYLDKLTATFMVRQLHPWFENISKRQVKSPRVYIADTGLLHSLLNLPTQRDLEAHPRLGASWESFVVAQIIRRLDAQPHECFYWSTHTGAELDLLVVRGRQRLGFEIKRSSAPGVTASMKMAMSDLKLKRLTVIHAGRHSFDLAKDIHAISASTMMQEIKLFSRS